MSLHARTLTNCNFISRREIYWVRYVIWFITVPTQLSIIQRLATASADLFVLAEVATFTMLFCGVFATYVTDDSRFADSKTQGTDLTLTLTLMRTLMLMRMLVLMLPSPFTHIYMYTQRANRFRKAS